MAEQILAMKSIIRQEGKHCGLIATSSDNLRERLEQGFRMLGGGIDMGLLIRSRRGMLAGVGRDRTLRAGLCVTDEPKPPLPRPPVLPISVTS